MSYVRRPPLRRLVARFLLVALVGPGMAWAQWPQWGGPHRNFTIETSGLADSWPESGPARIWDRALGDGFSAIIVDDGRLFTMYRDGDSEFTIALDAATGETVWQHENPSPFTPIMAQYGPGPHSTPLVVGDRLYSVGSNMVLHCFEKKTGAVIWRRDLRVDFGGDVPAYGYASSPLAWGDAIILPAGAAPNEEQPLIALDGATGRAIWQNRPTAAGVAAFGVYTSPILIRLGDEEQVVFLGCEQVSGVNPKDGTVLWTHPHLNRTGVNASTPIWNGADLVFCAAAYDSGARAVRLRHEGGQTVADEAWYSRKMRVHHGNVVLIDGYVYGSTGDFGPAFFGSIELATGRVAWRERGFSKATCVYGDGKLILLDENGTLALTTVKPEGLTVHSRCRLTQRCSWTVPTLVGQTLYIRDRHRIMALNLG
ncbi:MAG: PQQ-like beta-propeller repeat protein [Phycisphaerae bacterium]|jgi:outer membrane protein assembly factor BamB